MGETLADLKKKFLIIFSWFCPEVAGILTVNKLKVKVLNLLNKEELGFSIEDESA